MKAAIYVRVSTLEQADEGYSITEQIDKLKKYCDLKDWIVENVYQDPGFSGSNLKRPGMDKLIHSVENNNVDVVLVYKLDRLSRSQKDTLYLIEDVFQKNNTAFVSLNENFDTSSPFGRAMIGILAVFAQLEREQIKERMTMGKIGRAKSGKAMSWRWAPFGYKYQDDNYIVQPLEATIVKQIFDSYLAGYSITKLKDLLNDEGHIAKDIPWSYRTIRQTLDNPTYAGYTKYKDQIFEGNHEAIVSKEAFEKVQEELAIRQKKAYERSNNPRPFQAKYMISGLVRCGYCGCSLGIHLGTVRKDGSRSQVYKCATTRKGKNMTQKKAESCIPIRYQKNDLENAVLQAIDEIKFNPKKNTFNTEEQNNTKIYEKQLSDLAKKFDKLVTLYIDNYIPLETFEERKGSILSQQESIQSIIDSQTKPPTKLDPADAKTILNSYEGSIFKKNYDDQKIIVRQLIDHIVVTQENMQIYWNFEVLEK